MTLFQRCPPLPPGISLGQQPCAVFRPDTVIAITPVRVVWPRNCRSGGCACDVGCFQQADGLLNDAGLRLLLKGRPTWVAKRKIGEEKSRNAAMFDNVAGGSDDDRRNAVFFKVTGDQTHGLVANRSDGNEERRVRMSSNDAAQNFRCVGFFREAMAVHRRYAMEFLGQAAEQAALYEACQGSDRKVALPVQHMRRFFVPGKILRVKRLRRVGNLAGPNLPLRRFIFAPGAGLICRCDQGQARFRDRFAKAREGTSS